MEVNWDDNTSEPLNTSRDNVGCLLASPVAGACRYDFGARSAFKGLASLFRAIQSRHALVDVRRRRLFLLATQAAFLPLSQPLERKSTCKLWELKSWPR